MKWPSLEHFKIDNFSLPQYLLDQNVTGCLYSFFKSKSALETAIAPLAL